MNLLQVRFSNYYIILNKHKNEVNQTFIDYCSKSSFEQKLNKLKIFIKKQSYQIKLNDTNLIINKQQKYQLLRKYMDNNIGLLILSLVLSIILMFLFCS